MRVYACENDEDAVSGWKTRRRMTGKEYIRMVSGVFMVGAKDVVSSVRPPLSSSLSFVSLLLSPSCLYYADSFFL